MMYARVAAATLVLLAVAACSGGDPADGEPTTAGTPSASPSPTPTLAPPTIPPEAQEHSADGAAAFVKYYVSLVNYAATSGDTTPLSSNASSNCGSCTRLADRYATIYRGGGSSENPKWAANVTSSQLIDGAFFVTVDLSTAAHRWRRTADARFTEVPAGRHADIYSVKWTGTNWTIDRLVPQEVPE
ncbi:DUF6318 family protein [Mumia qirimensis]|uniref:DUF6318 family protein n=1 Tax=Mumia qirimensis TaxID=3234852 RepID=UPI00351D23E3